MSTSEALNSARVAPTHGIKSAIARIRAQEERFVLQVVQPALVAAPRSSVAGITGAATTLGGANVLAIGVAIGSA